MPPNFICFFLSFLSSALPQKKTRDWFLLKTRKAGKGAKQKEQKTRDGRLIKIEKKRGYLSSLFSHFSLFFRENRRMGENTNKKQDGIVTHSHYFSTDCFR